MGILYIISTPIGNLEDITLRAIKMLFRVDFIACEDTRKTGLLLNKLYPTYTSILNRNNMKKTNYEKIKPKLISYYQGQEKQKLYEIIDILEKGQNVALVSDNGTPLICDPGYLLVKECIRKGIDIVSIPGPSAVISALTVSGLPVDKFLFLGFMPKSTSKRKKIFKNIHKNLKNPDMFSITTVFYESPYRLRQCLIDLKNIFGDIEIVIAREITKIHEEIWLGKISNAIDYFKKPKGEFVLLFRNKKIK